MKYAVYVLLVFLLACNNSTPKSEPVVVADTLLTTANPEDEPRLNHSLEQVSWSGALDGKTNIFLHYQVEDSLLIGEIVYLDTKERKPIRLLGTIEGKNSYRLLEFEPSGNISGVITASIKGNTLEGEWVSPKTRKELSMKVERKDTALQAAASTVVAYKDIFGFYAYQYGEKGYQGGLEISPVGNGKVAFGMSAVTSDPARNIASVDTDTISLMDTHFRYKLPGTDHCEFEVKFYPGFALVRYINGSECDGQFGHNATIEGIFLRTNKDAWIK